MRIILYTGKGGVGKTSIAAATALRSAELGHKTVVLSTDAAHSLADSFDIELGNEATPIAPNLWGQETDLTQTMDASWGNIKDWMASLLAWRGLDQIMADEMAVLPGMEELASLLYITHYHDSNEYDILIVDCAPTGETLRLLGFPEILRWWMDRLFPIERKAASVVRPIVRPILDIPFPDDDVFESIQTLFRHLDRMRTLLTDPDVSSVRLVVNPEKMVIKEAQRTFTYLNLYGYSTDLIVCNRLIPDEVGDSYFDSWKQSQDKYYRMIEESFSPIPILSVPLLDQEVVGKEMLSQMVRAIFGDGDPTQVFYQGKAREIQKEDGYYVLSVPLPFVGKEDISLARVGDELIIHVGKQKRNITLPRTLVGLPTAEAKFEGNNLQIRFNDKKGKAKAKN